MITLLIVILLIFLLLGAAPAWPYSRNWGYGPVGMILMIILIVVLLRILGVV